jgi:hypothetical protein
MKSNLNEVGLFFALKVKLVASFHSLDFLLVGRQVGYFFIKKKVKSTPRFISHPNKIESRKTSSS